MSPLNPLCVEGLRIGAEGVEALRSGRLTPPRGNRPVVSVSNISTYIRWFNRLFLLVVSFNLFCFLILKRFRFGFF